MLFLKKLLSPKIKKSILSIILLPERITFFIIQKIARKYPYLIINLIPKKLKYKFKNDLSFRYNMNKYIKLLLNEAEAIIFNNLSDIEKSQSVKKEWTVGRGIYWYEREEKKFSIDDINKRRVKFINFLDSFIKNYPVNVICEIGTGDGRFINYLLNKYSKIKYFIGIDLIKELMEKNNEKYTISNKNQIKFLTGEISERYEEILNISNNKYEDENLLFIATRTLLALPKVN